MPDISVLTAAWLDTTKKVDWLVEAGESVMAQEGVDVEWVVVDDASPLAPERLPQDPRIHVVRASKRQGPSLCRNTAASLARADALVALDADDVFAAPDVLARLMEAWRRRPDRFYYGNIQLIQNGVPGKVIPFPVYNFMQTLDPKGLVPVTALLSREAWYKAGGWKTGLDAGLEDVEFWISVGKAGFCGYKLDMTTILYRRHPESRTRQMERDGLKREMQERIRDMHADLYGGRLPVGCCGGSKRGGNVGKPLPLRQPAPRAQALDDLPGGKVWIRYMGARTGKFFIRGQATGAQYEIAGTSAELQIHAQDAHFFRSLGRGKDFAVGIAPPRVEEPPEPEPEPEGDEYRPPPPEPAEVVSLEEPQVIPDLSDGVQKAELPQVRAMVESQAEKVERIGEAMERATGDVSEVAEEIAEAAKDHPLEDLSGVSASVKAMLEMEGWTVPQLARALPEELMPYPGVGRVTAGKLVEEAKRLWGG